jgi:hypothetical protein
MESEDIEFYLEDIKNLEIQEKVRNLINFSVFENEVQLQKDMLREIPSLAESIGSFLTHKLIIEKCLQKML